MFVLFGIFQVELYNAADVVVALVDGEFESFSLFVSILEDLLVDFFIEDDIDINRSS